jgi:hypothetical protein
MLILCLLRAPGRNDFVHPSRARARVCFTPESETECPQKANGGHRPNPSLPSRDVNMPAMTAIELYRS